MFYFLSQEFAILHLGISCAHNVLAIYALSIYLFIKLRKNVFFFHLSQSTINPVDAVYQPSPLEQSVISTMPSQAVIPPGMVYRKNLSRNTLEQSRMQLQSRWRGCIMVDSFCVTYAIQVHTALSGAHSPQWCKGRQRSRRYGASSAIRKICL